MRNSKILVNVDKLTTTTFSSSHLYRLVKHRQHINIIFQITSFSLYNNTTTFSSSHLYQISCKTLITHKHNLSNYLFFPLQQHYDLVIPHLYQISDQLVKRSQLTTHKHNLSNTSFSLYNNTTTFSSSHLYRLVKHRQHINIISQITSFSLTTTLRPCHLPPISDIRYQISL